MDSDDLLSSLPDCILVDIISRLPTASAVATSVLSQRWLRLWTQITDLCFDYSPRPREWVGVDISGFFTIVDGVIRQLTSPFIGNFTIIINTYSVLVDEDENCESHREYWRGCCSQVESLISLLCDRGVRSLDIFLDSHNFRPQIPPCVFRNTSLVALGLCCSFDFKLPEEIILPCLKKLHLVLDSDRVELIRRLLPSCPLLEDFELRVDYDELYDYMQLGLPSSNDTSVVISSPSLKRLDLGFSAKWVRVVIDAPNLEGLEICEDDVSLYCFAKNPTSLQYVSLQIFCEDIPMHRDHISVLVAVIASTRSLQLTCGMAKGFNSIGNGTSPMFRNLTKLDILLGSIDSWKVLFDFLISLPNLEFLLVCDHSGDNDECLEEAAWWPLNSAPLCLSSHLKIIHITRNGRSKNDLKLIKYILRNATVLELLEVHISSHSNQKGDAVCQELEFCEELLKCSRSSPACKIRFAGRHLKVSREGVKIGELDSRSPYQ